MEFGYIIQQLSSFISVFLDLQLFFHLLGFFKGSGAVANLLFHLILKHVFLFTIKVLIKKILIINKIYEVILTLIMVSSKVSISEGWTISSVLRPVLKCSLDFAQPASFIRASELSLI